MGNESIMSQPATATEPLTPFKMSLVSKVMEVADAMFGTASSIVFVDSTRFRQAVAATAGYLDGNDEKAEELLLAYARVWPRDYAEMIPAERRLRIIKSILDEQEAGI